MVLTACHINSFLAVTSPSAAVAVPLKTTLLLMLGTGVAVWCLLAWRRSWVHRRDAAASNLELQRERAEQYGKRSRTLEKKETAEVLGISERTVLRRLHRARCSLYDVLQVQ